MSGSDVLELQRGVTYLGYPTPRTDTFTSETKSDIVHYERSTGLTVDGVVSEAEGSHRAPRGREARPRGGARRPRRLMPTARACCTAASAGATC